MLTNESHRDESKKAPNAFYWTRSKEELHKESLKLAASPPKGIVPFLEEEIENYEKVVADFRAGKIDEKIFIPFRLLQGTYGQRQPNKQMFRVKAAGGILLAEAMEALGYIAEHYAPLKKGHVTTRENVQFHHMSLEDCGKGMRLLGEVGLTTREACGNTVRNVVAPPTAGVCPDELFDPTPYLVAYVRFAVRHPLTQTLPRKFKSSFTGCASHDAILSRLHDLSFVAQLQGDAKGFKVYVGGGTSIMNRYAQVLYDFVPVEDFLRVAEAIWTVYNNANQLRPHRMMSRIKVLIDKIGMDAFKKQVDEALKSVPPIDPSPLMKLNPAYQEAPPPLASCRGGTEPSVTPAPPKNSGIEPGGKLPPSQFARWKETNAARQKQAGYHYVTVRIPLGDIHAHQWPVLASIAREHAGGQARITQEQNLVFRWVPESSLEAIWSKLKEINFAEPDANTITDLVACPATDSCKLGITSSMGLARAIRESFQSWNGMLEDPLVKKIHIKISGCPNGCSQHHIADIGFQGAAMKGPSGQQVPAYDVLVGGSYGQSADGLRYGERLNSKVPSKRIPEFIRELITYYKQNRNEGEEFKNFVVRVGTAPLEAIAAGYKNVEPFSKESISTYTDWEKPNVFHVVRGEGECAL